MSRPLRIQCSGAVYHVMNRGNSRQNIFRNASHYELFLRCLAETVDLWELKLHAFSLMPNHYHLLIETPIGNLSWAIRYYLKLEYRRYQTEFGITPSRISRIANNAETVAQNLRELMTAVL